MKSILKIAEMIDHGPAWLKDAIYHTAKDNGQKTDDLELHRHSHSEKAKVNGLDPKSRKALKYVSYRTQDRDDEIVIPEVIDLTQFKKYMHVLVNHNYSTLPVGSDETIEADDFGIKALTQYADTGEGTLANIVWHLVRQGHLKSSSIGFVPLASTKPGARDWDHVANQLQTHWPEFSKEKAEKSVSRIITKGVLLEHSDVSVPCNADAELISVCKGMMAKKEVDEKTFSLLGWKMIPDEETNLTLVKGDVEGHPFRGNQFTGGDGSGGSFSSGKIQEKLDSVAGSIRSSGSKTYTSMMVESPNMGERHFIDIENKDPRIEREQGYKAQESLNEIASQVRSSIPGAKTYVSQEKSPNMGTRVFMDIEIPGKHGKKSIANLTAEIKFLTPTSIKAVGTPTKFLSDTMVGLLNQQIANEMFAAYRYLAVSAAFHAKGLMGFSKWMYDQALGEIEHVQKVFEHLLDAGADVQLPPVPAPQADSATKPADLCNSVLEQEKSVTKNWQDINAQAETDNDAATAKLAQDFVSEQIEEENAAQTLCQTVALAVDGSGLLTIDADLKDRSPIAVAKMLNGIKVEKGAGDGANVSTDEEGGYTANTKPTPPPEKEDDKPEPQDLTPDVDKIKAAMDAATTAEDWTAVVEMIEDVRMECQTDEGSLAFEQATRYCVMCAQDIETGMKTGGERLADIKEYLDKAVAFEKGKTTPRAEEKPMIDSGTMEKSFIQVVEKEAGEVSVKVLTPEPVEPFIRVISTPNDTDDIVKAVAAGVTKAISRRTGKLM